jgi:Methylase involved in ubiquinone/menaquinone biosynthesis
MQDYRSSHLNKGSDYDCLFQKGSYPHLVWQFESGILTNIITSRFRGRPFRHLDVACGTGRIVEHVLPFTQQSCGIDISASMLARARTRMNDVAFIRGDFAAPNPPFKQTFDLITCFRFFLHAEPHLRSGVAANARKLLKPNGVFVFNNHRNYHSLTYRLLRAAGRNEQELACMSHREACEVIADAGLKIADIRHVGVVPGTDHRMYLPYPVSAGLESIAVKVKGLRYLSNDLLYICERA